ncbi:MAG: hypothetical protein KGL57_02620 [Burkholderiales bacterium]|nr:hypothetical protein [Burkholderiales bacterium]
MHQATRLASRIASVFAFSALSLTLVSSAWADTKDRSHEPRPPKAAASTATPAASAASGAMGCGMMTPPDCEKRQEEMKKIRETKDPAERQKMMDKHHKEMHDEHMGKDGMGKGGMGMGKGGMGMGASAPMMGASK